MVVQLHPPDHLVIVGEFIDDQSRTLRTRRAAAAAHRRPEDLDLVEPHVESVAGGQGLELQIARRHRCESVRRREDIPRNRRTGGRRRRDRSRCQGAAEDLHGIERLAGGIDGRGGEDAEARGPAVVELRVVRVADEELLDGHRAAEVHREVLVAHPFPAQPVAAREDIAGRAVRHIARREVAAAPDDIEGHIRIGPAAGHHRPSEREIREGCIRRLPESRRDVPHLRGIHGPVPEGHFVDAPVEEVHPVVGIRADHPARAAGPERADAQRRAFLRAIHIEPHLPAVPRHDADVIPLTGDGHRGADDRLRGAVEGVVLEAPGGRHAQLVRPRCQGPAGIRPHHDALRPDHVGPHPCRDGVGRGVHGVRHVHMLRGPVEINALPAAHERRKHRRRRRRSHECPVDPVAGAVVRVSLESVVTPQRTRHAVEERRAAIVRSREVPRARRAADLHARRPVLGQFAVLEFIPLREGRPGTVRSRRPRLVVAKVDLVHAPAVPVLQRDLLPAVGEGVGERPQHAGDARRCHQRRRIGRDHHMPARADHRARRKHVVHPSIEPPP